MYPIGPINYVTFFGAAKSGVVVDLKGKVVDFFLFFSTPSQIPSSGGGLGIFSGCSRMW